MRFFTNIELSYQSMIKVEMLALELLFQETRKCRTRDEYELHRLAEMKLGEKYKQLMEEVASSNLQENE